jgi:phosphoethanolamine N-methyltransferase
MNHQTHDDEYDPTLLTMLELIWGEGFLSPGGPAAIDEIIEGLDLADKLVVDIGSGLGGVDTHLAKKHGARVIGLEIERPVAELARERVELAGLSDRIDMRHCEPGPLPLEDSSVDLVFSKDSLIHLENKHAAFQDYFRVLNSGGWLAMSDWMCGDRPYSKDMEYWFEMEGLTYHMQPLEFYADALEDAGFVDIAVSDTSSEYRELGDKEYALMQGDLNAKMEELLGGEMRDHFIENWRALTVVLHKGELRTGRIRARKAV